MQTLYYNWQIENSNLFQSCYRTERFRRFFFRFIFIFIWHCIPVLDSEKSMELEKDSHLDQKKIRNKKFLQTELENSSSDLQKKIAPNKYWIQATNVFVTLKDSVVENRKTIIFIYVRLETSFFPLWNYFFLFGLASPSNFKLIWNFFFSFDPSQSKQIWFFSLYFYVINCS